MGSVHDTVGNPWGVVGQRARAWGCSLVLCGAACGGINPQNDEEVEAMATLPTSPTEELAEKSLDQSSPGYNEQGESLVHSTLAGEQASNGGEADPTARKTRVAREPETELEGLGQPELPVSSHDTDAFAATSSAALAIGSLAIGFQMARPVGVVLLPGQLDDPSCSPEFAAVGLYPDCKSGGPRVINAIRESPSLDRLLGSGAMSPGIQTGTPFTTPIGLGRSLVRVPMLQELYPLQFDRRPPSTVKTYAGAAAGVSCAAALTRTDVVLHRVSEVDLSVRPHDIFGNFACITAAELAAHTTLPCVLPVATDRSLGAVYLEGDETLRCIYRDPSAGDMRDGTIHVELWAPFIEAE